MFYGILREKGASLFSTKEDVLRVFHTVAENSINAIALADAEESLIYVNKPFVELWGHESVRDIIGRNVREFWQYPEDAAAVIGRLRRAGGWTGELDGIKKDGTLFSARVTANAARDESGKISYMMGAFLDMTERKYTEKELRIARERLEEHIANSPFAVIEFDSSYRVIRWSGTAEQIFGWEPHEIIGKRITEIRWVHEEDRDSVAQIARNMRTGRLPRIVSANRNYRKDGSVIHCEWYDSAIYDEHGQLTSVLSHGLNISERRDSEKQIKESEEKFSIIFNQASAPMSISRLRNGIIIDINEAWLKTFGFTRSEVIDKTTSELGISSNPGERETLYTLLHENGSVHDMKVTGYRTKTNSKPVFLVNQEIIEFGGEKYVFTLAQDITKREQAEKSLLESEAMLNSILDTLPAGVIIADAKGRIIRDNAASRELWGVPPETNSWGDYSDWVGWWPDTGERIKAEEWSMTRALLHGETTRNELIQNQSFKGDEWRYYLNNVSPLRDAGGRIIGGVAAMVDVTDRLAAEKSLRESEARLSAILEQLPVGVGVIDMDGRFILSNSVMRNYMPRKIMPSHDPGEEGRWRAWDGEGRPLPVHQWPGARALRGEIVSPGIPFLYSDGGGDKRWINRSSVPFRSADGGILGAISIVQDITEIKQAEEVLRGSRDELDLRVQERTAELEERAEQLSRLSSRLTLTEYRERQRLAGILHDHLQQLMVGAKMTQETLIGSTHPTLRPMAERVLKLINQLIQTSRYLTAELSPPILWSGDLSASLEWLSRWMDENHGFKVDLEIRDRVVMGRKDLTVLLFHSVRELLFNVLKHAGVKSARVKIEGKEKTLQITVKDGGTGFDPKKIWQHADTRNQFGLFTIREQLMPLGGTWKVESVPNAGSTITLVVPLDVKRPAEKKSPGLSGVAPGKPVSALAGPQRTGRKIRILLADDHPVMREGLSRMLNSHSDIEVVGEASDGEEAVRLARELVPDVILMDISMPNMDGMEATRIIHPEFPHTRIIGLSMYEEDDLASAMIRAGATGYCSKGEKTDILLSKIRGED